MKAFTTADTVATRRNTAHDLNNRISGVEYLSPVGLRYGIERTLNRESSRVVRPFVFPPVAESCSRAIFGPSSRELPTRVEAVTSVRFGVIRAGVLAQGGKLSGGDNVAASP